MTSGTSVRAGRRVGRGQGLSDRLRAHSRSNGRRVSEVRTFSTMTRSLQVMRDWLLASGVTIAAIESTST